MKSTTRGYIFVGAWRKGHCEPASGRDQSMTCLSLSQGECLYTRAVSRFTVGRVLVLDTPNVWMRWSGAWVARYTLRKAPGPVPSDCLLILYMYSTSVECLFSTPPRLAAAQQVVVTPVIAAVCHHAGYVPAGLLRPVAEAEVLAPCRRLLPGRHRSPSQRMPCNSRNEG
jgi:hypothetical protein